MVDGHDSTLNTLTQLGLTSNDGVNDDINPPSPSANVEQNEEKLKEKEDHPEQHPTTPLPIIEQMVFCQH